MDFLKDTNNMHFILIALGAVLFIIAIMMVVGSAKKEGFRQLTPKSPECKASSDYYCNARCSFNGDSAMGGVTIGDNAQKVAMLQNVMNTCGEDWKIVQYCNETQPPCPIAEEDLILGGTHEKARNPISLVNPIYQETDPNVPQTNWGAGGFRPDQ